MESISSTEPVIETKGLRKKFGDKVVVEDLTLTVPAGEVFGFLGPNGAGKTTSIKMLLGLVKPTAGEGRVLGLRLGDYRARAKVGFLPEHFRFHEWMTAKEFLKLHADLYKLPSRRSRQRIPELLDLVGLTPHADKSLQAFSKGMKQRIGLAQALLNDPKLVVLDEPTSGLDPVGRRLVRDIIRNQREQGTTVFLNSHLLSEVEITCDRVAFIKQGKVVKISPLHSLVAGELSVEARVRNLQPETINGLARWSPSVRVDGEYLWLTLAKEEHLPALNRYLVEQGAEVYALQPQKPSLEDLFIQIVDNEG